MTAAPGNAMTSSEFCTPLQCSPPLWLFHWDQQSLAQVGARDASWTDFGKALQQAAHAEDC